MPQQENGDLPASLPTSTSTRVCKGACLGRSGSLSPSPASPSGPLSCSCQAMARIMPKSVNQENVFFLEKHSGSADRPPKTPAMQFAQSLTYSNPETYVNKSFLANASCPWSWAMWIRNGGGILPSHAKM